MNAVPKIMQAVNKSVLTPMVLTIVLADSVMYWPLINMAVKVR